MFAVGGGLFLLKNLFCYFMGVEMIVGKPAYELVRQRVRKTWKSGRNRYSSAYKKDQTVPLELSFQFVGDIHRFGNVHTIRFLNAFLYLKGVRILTYIVVWVSGRERSYFSRNDFHLLRQKSDWKLEDAA